MNKESYFDGGLLSFIGHSIVAFFIIALTLRIATPWAVCFIQGWKVRHTVIDGQRLYFDGTDTQLFGNWIKWFLLTIITLGIYSFWLILFENQIQTTSASPCRTQVQPAASFLVCSLIFIEYKNKNRTMDYQTYSSYVKSAVYRPHFFYSS